MLSHYRRQREMKKDHQYQPLAYVSTRKHEYMCKKVKGCIDALSNIMHNSSKAKMMCLSSDGDR